MTNPRTASLKETIDLMDTFFSERRNSEPRSAAKYYVVYTCLGCGTSFRLLLDEIQKIRGFEKQKGRRSLEKGRKNLIEDGMMAKILFCHKNSYNDKKSSELFQGEQYLPINPNLVCSDVLQGFLKDFDLSPTRRKLLDDLSRQWQENFLEHGFLIKKGIISVYCTTPWLLFSLLNYLSIWKEREKTLCIMTSSTNWCRPPLFSPLTSTLKKGLRLNVLLDTSRETEGLKQMKEMRQVEIRHLPKEEVITSRLTFAGTEYVVDMHKVLGKEKGHSKYIATIYLHMKREASQFRQNFDSRWNRAPPY
jgi:hypothetical protein